jgi:hypothetical protein
MNIFLSLLATLFIIFITPMVVYGLLSPILKIKEPDKKLKFFLGVLIEKVGTTIGFVAFFYLARDVFVDKWIAYALIWFLMYAITEIGQIYTNDYSKKEAVAGIISEAIYFPAAAFILTLLINIKI